MIIHSVRLRNIRSYADAKIDFSEGTTLLSGDIGSGKSTILLAIEFAIFGIIKGILSGGVLMRHGTNSSSVELKLEIDNKTVLIKRGLKRTNTGIVQDTGSIAVDGVCFEGTPQELKSRILALLGYPESLISRSKSLIFRYTVFTPQEEMKKILFESKDDRLNILRKLFDIDKYKTVKENSINYSRDLKNKISLLKGRIEATEARRKDHERYKSEMNTILRMIRSDEAALSEGKKMLLDTVGKLGQAEKTLDEYRKKENACNVMNSELESQRRQLDRCTAELKKSNLEIAESLRMLEGFDFSKASLVKDVIEEKNKALKILEARLSELISKKSMNETKRQASEKLLESIRSIDKCPTCHQKVTKEHIADVEKRENVTIKICETNILKIEEYETKTRESIAGIRTELERYSQGEKEMIRKRMIQDSLEKQKLKKQVLEEEHQEIKLRIEEKGRLLENLKSDLESGRASLSELESQKKEMDRIRDYKTGLERAIAQKEAKYETLRVICCQLEAELDRLRSEEEALSRMNKRKDWLDEDFGRVLDLIEKNMLARIYGEFNSFFQEWFNILLEEETISVRLDDYFAPVVEQNGYEASIESLSGGERTSIALAYRLSLNRVINDFLTNIRTRDLIILDEPTEGFSSEQLDRVREVLSQTNVRQTIIVSHESKMEGLVDKIIRIQKKDHTSIIVA